MYSIVETGGFQYKVELGKAYKVPTLDAAVGSELELKSVLLFAGKEVQIGTPVLNDASVLLTASMTPSSFTRRSAVPVTNVVTVIVRAIPRCWLRNFAPAQNPQRSTPRLSIATALAWLPSPSRRYSLCL